MRTSWRAPEAERSAGPERIRRSGPLGVLTSALLVATLLASGCTLSEPYLIPRRSLELVTSLQPDMRSHAQVPAVREGDRAPVLIDYRALQMNDEELGRVSARRARFYRVQAAARNPLLLIGGVILGMALPHFAVGLAVGLDKPTGHGPDTDQRAITDAAGGALMLTLSGLHIAAGVLLIGLAERNPRVEGTSAAMLNQYLTDPLPTPAPEPEGGKEQEKPAESE